MITLNPKVDKYLVDGCMRCKLGATPDCKVNKWRETLENLRQIALDTGLTEEIKWGVPVYTHNGKNIIIISALKDYAFIGFFKGALLPDDRKILQKQGNTQSDRIVKFTNADEVVKLETTLKAYILQAIDIEVSGKKFEYQKKTEPLPQELLDVFEQDETFKTAFYKLSEGRQRGYIIYFSQPKQSKTRVGRIEKCKQQIFDGIGINDKYKC